MTELNGPDAACCHLVAGVSARISADSSHRSSLVNSPTEETTTENMTNEEMETTYSQEPAENSSNALDN